jgi:electron transfer flavoprotein beta subunit
VTVAACVKWVDRRPEVDPLNGVIRHDGRSSGASDADQAALEWALRLGDAWGDDVVAVTAGPPAADTLLRDAIAVGATRAVRVDGPIDAPSEAVAAVLAGELAGCRVVLCGDLSLDRGSGSVPAYLAARLAAAQALGLVGIEVGERGSVSAVRRLDGGRRERLLVSGPAVCSVEGSTARLRRAPLARVLSARHAAITVVVGLGGVGGSGVGGNGHRPTRPFRPRARALPAPHGDVLARLRSLTAAAVAGGARSAETLEPDAAADRILAALTEWGFAPPDVASTP